MKNKKICVLLAVLLLTSFSPSFCAEKTDEINVATEQNENIKANKASYEKALEAINDKDYKSAIKYLNAYINEKPKKYEAYMLRGDAFYALRQYENASKDYQTAIDLKTSDDKLITGTKYVSAVILGADKFEQLQNPELGNLYGRLMYAQKALNNILYETSYAKALEYNSHIYLPQPKKEQIAQINCPQKYGKILNPKGADELIYGAIEDIEKEDFTDAIFKSQKIISAYPEYYLGYYLNGVALSELEKDEEAVVAFNKAIQLNPDDFESFASLGNIYFDRAQMTFIQEDARKSVEYFNNALKLNPNCYLYYFYIGMNELQIGNVDVAISNFNKAIKIKPNDYNSLYYKLIAQYIKQDYPQVIDGAAKLIYKHVSNYNSVLYLRALAQYKMKDYDKSGADLDLILGNFGDIYNTDIVEISPKEQTLESYVYYLKALIAQAKDEGAKSDLEKAYKNPIISMLAKAREAIRPYEQALNGETLSIEDYKKFSDFYLTSFPKLLQSGVVITETDVDYQYDYIRTTFDDMGLSFVYKKPDYVLSTTKDFPYRKYREKFADVDLKSLASQISEEVKQDVAEKEKITPQLKTTSAPEEVLVQPQENSLAKVLASSSFGLLGPVAQNVSENSINAPENVKQEVVQGIAEDKKSAVSEENSDSVKKLVEEEKKIEEELPLAVKEQEKEVKVVKVQPEPVNINEKHAKINPEDLPKINQSVPEISEHDEVIVLEKTAPSLYSDKEKETAEKLISKNPLNTKTIDFEGFDEETQKAITKTETSLQKALADVAVEQVAEESEPVIHLPEQEENSIVEVPVVNVPEVNLPETKEKIAAEIEINKEQKDSQIMPDLALRPKALIEAEEPDHESEVNVKLQKKLQKAKEKQEAKALKTKAKVEAKAEKQRLKLEKIHQKELQKIQKAQEIVEKAVSDVKSLEEAE